MNDVTFRLPQEFVDTYRDRKPPFGFNGVGEFTFYRTYSHVKPDGYNESWSEVVQRVVDETYTIQKRHALQNDRPWSDEKAVRSAMEMYDRMWNMKFLPPGRGLWAMGAAITRERENYMALQNCAFISTKNMAENASLPFEFMMDVSMLGVGCGFDTLGEGHVRIHSSGDKLYKYNAIHYSIPDSREGWVESVALLIRAFLTEDGPAPIFSYDRIRPAGQPIRGFGGVASGPGPLKKLHEQIYDVFENREGEYITARDIVDVMNLIGQCVVAGNVRRTAQLAIGSPDDHDYLDLKNYKKNPERAAYGWTSNNSIAANVGMNYAEAAERTRLNGEPGYIWLDNAREFGRVGHPYDFMYTRPDMVDGFNPCVEQPLRHGEVCTLVETFPANHENEEDFMRTLKFAFLYAKTVTLAPLTWDITNEVVKENRRIGTSMTGIIQAIEKFGYDKFMIMADNGYEEIRKWDRLYSNWLNVNESIRVTTVKPSGTVSLLGGATPGLHRAESEYYIRRVRISKRSPMLEIMYDAGYHIEDAVDDPVNTAVISFPVWVQNVGRTISESNIEEQMDLAAKLQHYWSDNGVSVTVTFRQDEGHLIEPLLERYDRKLKAISFLPKLEGGAFPQMPYEEIDQATYHAMKENLKEIDWSHLLGSEAVGETGCSNDVCEIKFDELLEVV